jgi:excisionase family DNA binding protein
MRRGKKHIMQPEFVTLTQAAQCLQVTKRTVWNLVKRGELSSVKIARARRIPRSELERLAASAIRMQLNG